VIRTSNSGGKEKIPTASAIFLLKIIFYKSISLYRKTPEALFKQKHGAWIPKLELAITIITICSVVSDQQGTEFLIVSE
jgi:hypothetical protein